MKDGVFLVSERASMTILVAKFKLDGFKLLLEIRTIDSFAIALTAAIRVLWVGEPPLYIQRSILQWTERDESKLRI